MAYVASALIFREEEFINIIMTLAGALVVREFDDIVGAWFLTLLTPIKDQMTLKGLGFTTKDQANSRVAIYSFYAMITGLISQLVLLGVILVAYFK